MDRLLARMHVNRYILDLDRPLDALPRLPGCDLERIDPRTLSAEVPATAGLHALFDALAEGGVRVVAVRNTANRLEQLFMDMLEGGAEATGSGLAGAYRRLAGPVESVNRIDLGTGGRTAGNRSTV